jgi:hypothetical protein
MSIQVTGLRLSGFWPTGKRPAERTVGKVRTSRTCGHYRWTTPTGQGTQSPRVERLAAVIPGDGDPVPRD